MSAPLLIVNAQRRFFHWTHLPREIANRPRPPRYRLSTGAAANDEGIGG